MREPMAPGFYFGLDAETYHADPSIGSTDAKRLVLEPCEYYFHSHMNADRPADNDSPARQYGRALHCHVLEGFEVFKTKYAPSGNAHVDDLRMFCKAQDIQRDGLKEEVITRIKNELGLEIISETWWREIQIAAAMILKNPNLKNAFNSGAPEVSVFWLQDDIPCKARFDYLKLRAVVDLKSIRINRMVSFDRAVFNAIANYRYDLQAVHYLRGRAHAADHVRNGDVFGDPLPRDQWLVKLAETEKFTFVWVFYKADGAPIAKGFDFPVGAGAFEASARELDVGLSRYRAYLEQFGTEMWVNDDPIQRIDQEDLPPWMGL